MSTAKLLAAVAVSALCIPSSLSQDATSGQGGPPAAVHEQQRETSTQEADREHTSKSQESEKSTKASKKHKEYKKAPKRQGPPPEPVPPSQQMR